ncbi:unnamed protein product [Nezara viridula]|uniref:Uncharacterized protein n=1 Tax=Nezara viridula TaxID=85310 RepID=A0A9P0DXV9_NEZVI|nr:unnamed protein product [Nezara viridula]
MRPSKKNSTQLVKNKKKGTDGAESITEGTSEYIYKLTSDIQAIEDKLSKVEGVLSKKLDNASTSQRPQVNSVSFKTDPLKEQKVYNASDYVDDVNMVTGYPPFYDRNSYSLELHNRIIKPLKSSEPLPQQYPIDFDPKAAVSAIRSELEQWRKDNRQTYPTLSSVSILRNEASSCDLVTSISEENTVSRDVAEKDIPSSSEDSRIAPLQLAS